MFTRTKRFLMAATVAAASLGMVPAAQAVTHAGDSILLSDGTPNARVCTLTMVKKDSTGKPWGVTAAHCFEDFNTQEVENAAGELLAGPAELSQLELFTGSDDVYMDMAFFPLREGVDVDYDSIYSKPTWNEFWSLLSSNPSVSDFFNHPMALGDPIPTNEGLQGQVACQEGGSMGRTCGVILSADPESDIIVAFVPTIPGDSGGPLHVLGADGKRHIVGSLTGGPAVFVNIFDNPARYIEADH